MYNALTALYASIYDKSKEKAQKMCLLVKLVLVTCVVQLTVE